MKDNKIKCIMSKEKTNAINNTKYILTVLIVFLHCTIHADALDTPSHGYYVLDSIMKIIYDAATPAFFAISAYLFFRNLSNFNIELYTKKLFTRFKSLVIPFVSFQIIAFIIPSIVYIIRTHSFNYIPFDQFLFNIAHQEYNPPLWFLITLFEFVLWAPAIWVVINRFSEKWVLFICILLYALNIFTKPGYISLMFWMPIILFASLMGKRETEGKKALFDVSWKLGGALLIPAILLTYFFWGDDYKGFVYYTYRMVGGLLIIFSGAGLKYKPLGFQRYMMFVFCTHWIVKPYCCSFLPKTELFSFPRAVLVVILCTLTGWLINKFFPHVYSVLSGSR